MPNLKSIRRLRPPLPNVFKTYASQFALIWTALNSDIRVEDRVRDQPRADAAHLNQPESHYEVHLVYPGGGSYCSRRLRRRSRKLDEYHGYTATGNFANGKSRELSQVDGLSWKTSPTSTGAVAATIGSTGEATCSAAGTVTVTASAPQNLQFTVNNGVQNTSATISGTATLICQ
jgi:hypothetical protein